VHEHLDLARGEDGAAGPLGLRGGTEQALVEAAHRGDVVGEERDLD
jgi:hypothetical protein